MSTTGVSATTTSATSSSQGVVVVLVNGQPQIKSVETGLSDIEACGAYIRQIKIL